MDIPEDYCQFCVYTKSVSGQILKVRNCELHNSGKRMRNAFGEPIWTEEELTKNIKVIEPETVKK